MYWNMDNTARSEWANLVTSKTKDQQAQLARYAFNQNWWDLSVRATIAGKLWISWKSVSRWPITTSLPAISAVKIFRKATRWPLRVRRALEPESRFTGWRPRSDADYAGDGNAYGEHVQYSRL